MKSYKIKYFLKRFFHPFKYGFWTICNIYHGKIGMQWETYDGYNSEYDGGFLPYWTGQRYTTRQLRNYDYGFNSDFGFTFLVPFFIAYIIFFTPTIISNYKEAMYYGQMLKNISPHIIMTKNKTNGRKRNEKAI